MLENDLFIYQFFTTSTCTKSHQKDKKAHFRHFHNETSLEFKKNTQNTPSIITYINTNTYL